MVTDMVYLLASDPWVGWSTDRLARVFHVEPWNRDWFHVEHPGQRSGDLATGWQSGYRGPVPSIHSEWDDHARAASGLVLWPAMELRAMIAARQPSTR